MIDSMDALHRTNNRIMAEYNAIKHKTDNIPEIIAAYRRLVASGYELRSILYSISSNPLHHCKIDTFITAMEAQLNKWFVFL